MQLAIHLGVHCTDEERLLKSLLQNKGALARENISVPGPGRYRKTVVDAARKLRGDQASRDSSEMLIDAIVDNDSASRLVMSFENFICQPSRIFEDGTLYHKAAYKPMWLRNLFDETSVEFFMAIRNPATFIPAVFHHKDQKMSSFDAFLDGLDPDQIRWSEVIRTIRETNPGCPVTVWCNEDTPLIWPQVLQQVSGHDPATELAGGFNVLATIMNGQGMRRLRTYLADNPPRNEVHRRRIIATFLDKFAIRDAVEEELDVPGWTDDLVRRLTRNYEQDLSVIETLPGVNFIAP